MVPVSDNTHPASRVVAATTLFESNRDWARRLAHRFRHSADLDDLEQVAEIGLWLAATRFDPDRGQFDRYATVTIIGELKKHLRSNGWAVHVPRRVQEDSLAVRNALDRLASDGNLEPTISELARSAHLSTERVSEALRARAARYGDGERSITANDVDTTEAVIQRIDVNDAVQALTPFDRRLIELTFDRDLSQREIGALVGLSQSQVQRRLRAAFADMRVWLGPAESSADAAVGSLSHD